MKTKLLKSSLFPYFFISIWGLLFGGGFTAIYFLDDGITRIGDRLVEATNSNQLLFLVIGMLSLLLFVFNLSHTYWVTANENALMIRNLFKRRKIPWAEVNTITSLSWINLPVAKVKTSSEKCYYVHYPSERLNSLFEEVKGNTSLPEDEYLG